MAFFLWVLPSNREEWIYALIGSTIAVVGFFILFKTDNIELFENIYNLLFWTGFYVFWGIICTSIIGWMLNKLINFFKRKERKQIAYSLDLRNSRNGKIEDINPAWLMS